MVEDFILGIIIVLHGLIRFVFNFLSFKNSFGKTSLRIMGQFFLYLNYQRMAVLKKILEKYFNRLGKLMMFLLFLIEKK